MENQKNSSTCDDWQVFTKSIRERGKYLLENPIWTDCKFLVGIEDSHVKVSVVYSLFEINLNRKLNKINTIRILQVEKKKVG